MKQLPRALFRRLNPSRWRLGRLAAVRSSALIALLCGLLGFAFIVQIHSNSSSALPNARQEDLVSILDDLSSQEERLRAEINSLQSTQRRITSEGGGSQAALDEARKRADELGILAGTLPARGPGVVVTIHEGSQHVPAEVLLDALEELRGAGAEAIQVAGDSGVPVRVGAPTYFVDAEQGVIVDNHRIAPPYVFIAIGDPATMAAALDIPGGVVDTVRQAGGDTQIEQRNAVTVDALRALDQPQYASPVS